MVGRPSLLYTTEVAQLAIESGPVFPKNNAYHVIVQELRSESDVTCGSDAIHVWGNLKK